MEEYKRLTYRVLLSIFLILAASTRAGAERGLTVVFLDVGEGDAVYVETPTGEKILIDTGNPITGGYVAEFLDERGVRRVDSVFITHPHLDHMGGIFHILAHFEVGSVYDNGQPLPEGQGSGIYRWYAEAARGANYRALKAGDTLSWGSFKVVVLWPEPPLSPKPPLLNDWNANSLVLKLVYGETSFLLAGDATGVVEKALLGKGVELKAKVLKVGHHGAPDATGKDFLEAVRPAYAVISVNEGNIRGYPDEKILKRLEKRGIETLLTKSHGDIAFTLSPKGKLFLSIGKDK
jgi:beta-lactamase superfamily II metal-dependent hydrolase